MLPNINPKKTKHWRKLKEHHRVMKYRRMADLFHQDSERFSRFSVIFEDILVDYSKNIMIQDTVHLILGLAGVCKLKEATSTNGLINTFKEFMK